ncbi:MucR family transcriptional regulator [Sphingobium sp. TB-6]|uniref:MucR family transcriptional regulator n=1 Tax=Sphingobium sp. TB-6 TaxID=2728850 RepID=UPI00146BCD73|nr:MucR family transcriptional regulator [Sphingobium sp. TB-6]NML91444.1 MucR family transcriptional regulator [Sphingobium sp. TB-6]
MAEANQSDITALTVQLVSAFVSNNSVASDSLADLIKTTRAALTENPAAAAEEAAAPTFTPAVSVRKSLSSPDHIISLIDGKPYKTLKRHLAANDLTPEQYRERYKLPKTYPLVAQSYSESRRAVAEKIGLGKKPVAAAKPAEAAPKTPKKAASAPAKKPAKAAAVPAAKAAPAVADAPKGAANPAPAPVKKAAKAKDSTPKGAPLISNRLTSASAAPATAKGEARKRLGIAGPKADKANAKVEPAPAAEAAKAKPAKKVGAAPKAKSVSKPKTLKAALEAAGSHLGTDAKAAEPAPVKA